MTEERRLVIDDLTGNAVVISPSRQSRPNLPETGCPFCPGGLEAPGPYDVRWFLNRWPAMPDDRCEVVLYSPDHAGSLATLGPEGAAAVVRLWTARTAALGARDDVAYVLVFENRGPEVGATIHHPHGQIYAYPEVPPIPAQELASAECAICAHEPGDRLVTAADGWRAWVPRGPIWPFELVLATEEHIPDLPSTASDPLGALLADVVGRLDALFDAEMPYLLWVHQRPTDGGDWPTAHLHVHIAPALREKDTVRYLASAETGAGVFTNPVSPTDAASRLRGVA